MYYRLSNTLKREQIEEEFDRNFKFPNIYQPQEVINGLNEATLPIIGMETNWQITYAIWGILPTNYKDDWEIFQNVTNTLTVDKNILTQENWHHESFKSRRCAIIVSGFFTHFMHLNEVYPYYIGQEEGRPFLLAGIYNTLEDGFTTCSLLLGSANKFVKRFQNFDDSMPVILSKEKLDAWLDTSADISDLHNIIIKPTDLKLRANPIAKELFKQQISYNSILEPVDYLGLPFDEKE